MKKALFIISLSIIHYKSFCWGFYAHQKINYYAVFLLPPEMMVLYKPNISFLSEHAVDPDKRRYAVAEEGPACVRTTCPQAGCTEVITETEMAAADKNKNTYFPKFKTYQLRNFVESNTLSRWCPGWR